MKEKFEALVDLLDVPSGSLMGLYTLIMIASSVAFVIKKYLEPSAVTDFPPGVTDVYKFVVLTFAGSKSIKTLWGKPLPESANESQK